MKSVRVFVLLGAIALVPTVRAQSTRADTASRYRSRVLGVFDEASGEALENVRVLDVLNGNSALTTKTGTVSLAFLPDGGSLVRLQKIGYATQTFSVKISAADTAPLTVMLVRVAELPKVVTTDSSPRYISPNLRAFEDRMKHEVGGYFIDEATLRKNENRTLASLLETKPGVIFTRGAAQSAYLQQSPRCANGGPPQVFLDGVPMSPTPTLDPAAHPRKATTAFGVPVNGAGNADPASQPFNLAEYNISDLAAVEWYPDSEILPVEFHFSNNRCGALLLWTRER